MEEGKRFMQNDFTAEDTEGVEEGKTLPRMKADEHGWERPKEPESATSGWLVGPFPQPVEFKIPPEMYRMDTPEGRAAYEASYGLKIQPELAGQRRPAQAVAVNADPAQRSAETHAILG